MPRVTCTSTCSPDELQRLLQPRQDVVVEEFDTGAGDASTAAAAPLAAVFKAVGGPFRHYRRTVTIVGRGEYADLVRRRISHRLPAPARPWLLGPLVDRELRRPGTERSENSTLVRQQITYQLSIPVWSWFLTPLVWRELRRPRTDGSQPFWAPAERLDPRSGQVLGVLCLLSVVAGYLGTLLSQTITFAFDEFDAGLATQGNTLTAVRVGVLLALALVALADRRGRRPMLLFAATAGCLAAAAGAASVGVWTYGASQTISRSLSTAMLVLLLVLAAEEVPAGARAYAVSVLTLSAGLGSGMVVWLLPLADLGLRAWRILFLAPLLALPLVLFCSRRLPESRRFSPEPSRHGDQPDPGRSTGTPSDSDRSIGTPSDSDRSTGTPSDSDRSTGTPSDSGRPTGTPSDSGRPTETPSDLDSDEPAGGESTGSSDVSGTAGQAAHAAADPAGRTDTTARATAGGSDHAHLSAETARRAKRLFLLGIGALLFSMFAAPASQYLNEFLRTERSFSASEISVFQLSINTPAGIGVLIGGRFSDVRGRRRIGALGLLGGAIFTVLRYSQADWPMWMWGILAGIFGAASVPIMGAFGAELFGTSNRARSNGQITVLGVIGSMIGLQVVGRFTDAGGEFWHVFAMVAGAPLIVALLVLLAFPETAWRELEDLNPEDVEHGNQPPPSAAA